MADEAIKRLIELGVNATPAVRELEKLGAETQKQTSKIEELQSTLSSFGKGVGIAAALAVAYQAATAVIGAIQGVIDSLDDLNKKAQGLGVGVEQLQELEHAADMAGVKGDQLAKAMTSLTDKMADVENGTDKASVLLRKLGVTAKDDTYTAMLKVADAFAAAEDGTAKTQIAVELFGSKLATVLIPMLNAGSKGLKDAGDEAHRLGIVMSEETTKAAEEFNDNVSRLTKSLKAMGMALVENVLPWLRDLSEQLVKNIADFGRWDGLLQTIMERMFGTFAENVEKEGQVAAQNLQRIQAQIEKINKGGDEHAKAQWLPKLEAEAAKYEAQLRKSLDAQEALARQAQEAAAPAKTGTGTLPKVAGDETTKKIKKAKDETEKLKLELDDVAKALLKFSNEAVELERVPQIISAIEQRLRDLKDAGYDNSTEAQVLRKRLLDLQATIDPIKAVTLEIEKMREAQKKNTEAANEFWNRLALGTISAEEFEKGVNKHTDSVAKGAQAAADKVKTLSEAVGEMSARFITDFVDKMIDGFGRAEVSFGDMVESFLKQLAKLFVSNQMQEFLKLIEGAGQNSGSAAGWWTALASMFSAGKGAAWNMPGVQAMASGGILTGPTFFSSGGRIAVAGEADAEAVMPLQRTASGDLGVAGAPVNINVINNAGAEVKTATRDNSDGSRQIDIYIERKVKELVSNGAMDRAMRASYGVTRQPSMG